MSSFVISKKEYITVAGFVAGLANGLELWLYDYEAGRNSTQADYYKHFDDCYRMNAKSVQLQYHDPEEEQDNNDYIHEFTNAFMKGEQVAHFGDVWESIARVQAFFSSSIYQIEYPPFMDKVSNYYNKIIAAIYKKLNRIRYADCDAWGTFEI